MDKINYSNHGKDLIFVYVDNGKPVSKASGADDSERVDNGSGVGKSGVDDDSGVGKSVVVYDSEKGEVGDEEEEDASSDEDYMPVEMTESDDDGLSVNDLETDDEEYINARLTGQIIDV